MVKSFVFAALAASFTVMGSQSASAALYQGNGSDGYVTLWFTGEDRDNDQRIVGNELRNVRVTFDNLNGGPGQFFFESKSVSNFLFEFVSPYLGTASGVASYVMREYFCGTFSTPPCMPDDTGPTFWEIPGSQSFLLSNVSVAPVPLPTALPLLAAGLGGMGLFRRLRSRRSNV